MAVIEYDSYKQKLLAMDETFENLFKALEIEQARQELNRLELEAHEDGFWNDLERSQKNQMRSKQLHNKIHRYEKLVSTRDDLLGAAEDHVVNILLDEVLKHIRFHAPFSHLVQFVL